MSHAALRLMKEELSWRDMGEIKARYGRDTGEIQARYGRDMGEIWARYKALRFMQEELSYIYRVRVRGRFGGVRVRVRFGDRG